MRVKLDKELVDIQNEPKHKKKNLVLSILFDCIGNFSYLFPFVAEGLDLIWAPLAAFLMNKMYRSRAGKIASIVTFIEEILPGLDIIPSFTIMWFYTYIFKK
jgi:hypothetical protein